MSSAKKVCNEEARCHAMNESVLMWRERREGWALLTNNFISVRKC